MTVTAHNKRRFHGATDEPTPATCPESQRFSLRQLQPWLYNPPPSSKQPKPAQVKRPPKPQPTRKEPSTPPPPARELPRKARIRQWLQDNGDATAPQIARALGYKSSEHIGRLLREGIDGVGKKGECPSAGRRPMFLWGVVEDVSLPT
jgi:hypothetical protein